MDISDAPPAKYYSDLDEEQMLAFSNTLTSLGHVFKKHCKLAKQLCSDLCFSLKNTKENTYTTI